MMSCRNCENATAEITECRNCYFEAMEENERLRARVAELEVEKNRLERCNNLCHREISLIVSDLKEAHHCIAELEAANAWHPESEPPEDSRYVLIHITYGDAIIVARYHDGTWFASTESLCLNTGTWGSGGTIEQDFENKDVTHWRDLPALPEVEK